jgi:hypothetical protein
VAKSVRRAVQFNQMVWRNVLPEHQRVVVDSLADRLRTELTFYATRLAAAYRGGGRPVQKERDGLFETLHAMEVWSSAIAALGWYVSEMEEVEGLRKRLYALDSAPVQKTKRKGR